MVEFNAVAERQQRLCSQRAGRRFRTKARAARRGVGNEARGVYSRIKRQAQEHACVGYFFAVREGSPPAMRALSWRGAYLPTDV